MDKPIIISAIVFGAIFLCFSAIKVLVDAQRKDRSFHDRVSKWGTQAEKIYDDGETQRKKQQKFAKRFLNWFGFYSKEKDGGVSGIYTETPLDFQRAGIYDPKYIRTYHVARVVLLTLPFLVYFLYSFFTGIPMTLKNGFTVLYISVAFFLLPMFWLKYRTRKRRQVFERTFPNAMDLLVVCVEAGMGFDTAIARVAQEMELASPQLAQEFKILSLELKTGKTRHDCMENLAKRINLTDVDNLVNLLVQAEKFGTGIANALRIHSESMREKRYNKMEELAAKLPVKITFPLVLFIFPAMMVALIGPGIISIYRLFIQG